VQGYTIESPSASPSPSAASGGKTNTGAIAGGVVGGVVAIVAILSVLLFLCRRRRANRREETPVVALTAERNTGTLRPGEKYNDQLYRSGEAPPYYGSPNPNDHPAMMAPQVHHYKHNYQPVDCSPQEMPADFPSAGPLGHEYSEMPADSREKTIWVEMESPESTPQTRQGSFGGRGSPRSPQMAELASPKPVPIAPQPKNEGEMF
jgi:hypothetical protein